MGRQTRDKDELIKTLAAMSEISRLKDDTIGAKLPASRVKSITKQDEAITLDKTANGQKDTIISRKVRSSAPRKGELGRWRTHYSAPKTDC